MSDISWKRLNRNTLVDTPFLRVYQDTVKLPSGVAIDDYSVVNLNSPVLVVATDAQGDVLVMSEYRYAHDEMMPSLPAGMIDEGETPVEAAKRELFEESGYATDDFEYIGELYEYPTKLSHITHVVRARDITKQANPTHEETEQIENITVIPLREVKSMIENQQIKTAVLISALYLALPELRKLQ